MRQSLNKDLQLFVYFISVASVFLGDGGGPSESSSELPYAENAFLGIGTGHVYCVTVALAAAYLVCMFILYDKFGVGNQHAPSSLRHSYHKS